MDRQARMEEREFGFSIMNFSCSEILKFILKSVRHGIGVTFFSGCCLHFYRPSTHCCSEFFI